MPIGITRARRRVNRLLRHTYTRVPNIDILDSPSPPAGDGLDAYGDPEIVPGPAAPNQPCLFDDQQVTLMRTDHGTYQVATPMLYLPYDDPLKPDDIVENVTDPNGTVLVLKAVAELDSALTSPAGVAYRSMRLKEVTFP